jgi:outer membrane protein assembly factor BamB
MRRIALVALATLLVAGCPKNHAPDAPLVPSGPSAVTKGSQTQYWSSAVDPDGDSVCIRFDWGDGDTSNWSQYVASGESVSMTHAWSAVGSYSVRAQASDATGGPSKWSPACAVQITDDNRAPIVPSSPSGPAAVAKDSLASYSSAASDPDGDSVCIRFDWGDGDTSEWSQPFASGEAITASHVWRDTGVYQAMAQARDGHGEISGWSAQAQVVIALPGTLVWRYRTGGRVQSTPAIGADGTIYFGSFDSCVYALRPDGSLAWSYRTDGSVFSSPTIGSDGTIYVGSWDGYLYALGSGGALRWRFSTAGYVDAIPALGTDGTVYFGSCDSYFYALNPDGSQKWRFRTGDRVKSSAAIGSDGTIYVGSHDRHLYAFNPDGTEQWSYPVPSAVCSSPALGFDGTIHFGSDGGHVTALHPDGTLKWTYLPGGSVGWAGPAIGTDGNIYVGSDDGYIHAIDSFGSRVWRYWAGGQAGHSTPAVAADGTIYFSPHGGTLYALGPASLLKWSYETGAQWCGSAAIGPDGTVYFSTSDSCLYAIRGLSALANTPWPKLHHDSKNTGRVGGGR